MEKVTRMITDNPIQLLDVTGDYEPSAADLAWARGLVEDPCAALPSAPPVVLHLPAATAAPARAADGQPSAPPADPDEG